MTQTSDATKAATFQRVATQLDRRRAAPVVMRLFALEESEALKLIDEYRGAPSGARRPAPAKAAPTTPVHEALGALSNDQLGNLAGVLAFGESAAPTTPAPMSPDGPTPRQVAMAERLVAAVQQAEAKPIGEASLQDLEALAAAAWSWS